MPRGITEEEMFLVKQCADATERLDLEALVRLLRDDVRFTMPPSPIAYVGNRATVQGWVEGGLGRPPYENFRCVLTSANRMPAIANYIRRPGDALYRPFMIDVLRIASGGIAEIVAFELAGLVDAFALPHTLPTTSDGGAQ